MADRTWIKMCGITRLEDAKVAAEAGVDALGFVFAESPRRIRVEDALVVMRDLQPNVLRVGVFVDETPAEIARVVAATEIDRVQLHGFEEPMVRELVGTRVVNVFRARDETVLEDIRSWNAEFFFLDTYKSTIAGGTGQTFDWDIAREAREIGKMVLAGGLTPENVGDAVRDVKPFGVDVSTGIEQSPGIKDPDKIRRFIEAVREADRELSGATPAAG